MKSIADQPNPKGSMDPSAGDRVRRPLHIWCAFAGCAIVLLLLGLTQKPEEAGDGPEYVLTMHALMTTGSPAYTPEVGRSLSGILRARGINYYRGMPEGLNTHVEAGEPIHLGFLRTKDGRYFAIHFFLYPLISVPAEAFLTVTGGNPMKAMQLTNMLCIIALLAYIYFFSKNLTDPEKHWLVALFLLCGPTYYVLWPHPEVFTACLTLLTLLAWRDGRPVLGILAAALASAQNPPVAFIVPVIFVDYHVRWLAARDWQWRLLAQRRTLGHAALMIIAGSLALLSPLFYLAHYGTPNVIVKVAGVNAVWITWARLKSLWLDLNQGIILGDLGIMALCGGGVVAALLSPSRHRTRWGELVFPALVLCLAVAMSLPTLTQGNWNAGISIFVRYGLWLVPPVLLAALELFRMAPAVVRTWSVTAAIAVQALLVIMHSIFAPHYDHLKLTGISKSVIRAWPGWYNPIPEIFAERTAGAEGVMLPGAVFTFPRQGSMATKILVVGDAPAVAQDRKSFTVAGTRWIAEKQPGIVKVEGCTYLNGRFTRSLVGSHIAFDDTQVSWGSGWSSAEPGWRWTDGKSATLSLPPVETSGLQGHLELYGRFFAQEPYHVRINGTEVFHSVGTTVRQQTDIPFDPKLLHAGVENTVTLEFPDAKVRGAGNSDDRALSYSLEWMMFK